MTLSRYLTLMTIATLLCWASFFIVMNSVNPFNTAVLGYVFFYASLFLSLVGSLSLLGFLFRRYFGKNQFVSYQVLVSFRQSIWFSLLVVVSLYLQSHRLVAWWNLLILFFIICALEFYFIYQGSDVEERN